ncbi:MAG: lysoplasmalogenase [Burkholderiaceae bacterium]|nr:lysoplasmalogenase [Sulfuritalea sp.]MCF8175691.1 lysoplasmalogenase [Burkholderiaceae bacterium]
MKTTSDPVLAVVIGVLAACLYLVGLALDLFWLKLLTKPWPVLMLAAAVWRHAGPGAGRHIARGLLAGAVGDICLALPDAFLPGMIAFAIGHGLYVAAFLKWSRRPALSLLVPIGIFAACGLWLMLPGAGPMTVPLLVYVLVIGAMIWRAAACTEDVNNNLLLRWGPLAGAVLFAFSDFLIGIHRFAHPLPGAAFAIILTYWAGQALFAATAIRIGNARAAVRTEQPL